MSNVKNWVELNEGDRAKILEHIGEFQSHHCELEGGKLHKLVLMRCGTDQIQIQIHSSPYGRDMQVFEAERERLVIVEPTLTIGGRSRTLSKEVRRSKEEAHRRVLIEAKAVIAEWIASLPGSLAESAEGAIEREEVLKLAWREQNGIDLPYNVQDEWSTRTFTYRQLKNELADLETRREEKLKSPKTSPDDSEMPF